MVWTSYVRYALYMYTHGGEEKNKIIFFIIYFGSGSSSLSVVRSSRGPQFFRLLSSKLDDVDSSPARNLTQQNGRNRVWNEKCLSVRIGKLKMWVVGHMRIEKENAGAYGNRILDILLSYVFHCMKIISHVYHYLKLKLCLNIKN